MEEQKLKINSECKIFEPLIDEFNAALNSLIMIANESGKEGELTVKLKVKTINEQRFDKDKLIAEWPEPIFSWDITRKIKEDKIKMSGSGGHDFMLKFDDEGKAYILEASPQITVDELLKHINGKAD